MAIANAGIWMSLIILLLILLVPLALLVVLQVWLCRQGRRLGLILPVLSLLFSLVVLLLCLGFSRPTVGVSATGGNGQVIYQEETRVELTPGAVGALSGAFLVFNIPTVIFGGIWLHYKNRRDFQDDLKRMKIEDLE